MDGGARANSMVDPLLDIGETLFEYCDSLKIKVRVHCWINISASLLEILYNSKTANEADLLPM